MATTVLTSLIAAHARTNRQLNHDARCRQAALRAASAAGPLGVSVEEAARRGAEVDRILRQREEEDALLMQTGGTERLSPATTPAAAETIATGRSTRNASGMVGSAAGGASAAAGGSGGGREAAESAKAVAVPRLGKLEDRKLWALLAAEAVQLGECRAAAEYLAAAQRHNDAFHDRDNVIRYLLYVPPSFSSPAGGVGTHFYIRIRRTYAPHFDSCRDRGG